MNCVCNSRVGENCLHTLALTRLLGSTVNILVRTVVQQRRHFTVCATPTSRNFFSDTAMTNLRISDNAISDSYSTLFGITYLRSSTKYYIYVTDVIFGWRRYVNINSERDNTSHEIPQDTSLTCPILRWCPLRIV